MDILIFILIFLYGIVIGSFLNVCIYRIPLKENIVHVKSHCMNCGYDLKWYDLIPLFSYLSLGGRCRKCDTRISAQYPVVEAANGVLYVWIFSVHGLNIVSVLYCLMTSALLVLGIIDIRTYEIPLGINLFIGILGVIQVGIDLEHWMTYGIGLLSVSLFLGLIYVVTKGRGIGGGDIKLMAVSGLMLGWQKNISAFFIGCILASVIHLCRMKFSGADRRLAFGPYLAAGIFVSMMWGESLISAYLRWSGFVF